MASYGRNNSFWPGDGTANDAGSIRPMVGMGTNANRASNNSSNLSLSDFEEAAYGKPSYSRDFTGGGSGGSAAAASGSLLGNSSQQQQKQLTSSSSFLMDQRPIMQMASVTPNRGFLSLSSTKTSFQKKGGRGGGYQKYEAGDDYSSDDWNPRRQDQSKSSMNRSQQEPTSYSANEDNYQNPQRGNGNPNFQSLLGGSNSHGNQGHYQGDKRSGDGFGAQGGKKKRPRRNPNSTFRRGQNKSGFNQNQSGGYDHQNQNTDVVQANQLQMQNQLQETLNRLQRLEADQKKKDQHMKNMEQMLRKRKLADEINTLQMANLIKQPRNELTPFSNQARLDFFSGAPLPHSNITYGDIYPLKGVGMSRGKAGKGGVKRLNPNAQVGQNKDLPGSLNRRNKKNKKNQQQTGAGQPQGGQSGSQQQGGQSGSQKQKGGRNSQQQGGQSGTQPKKGGHTAGQRKDGQGTIASPGGQMVSPQQKGARKGGQQQKGGRTGGQQQQVSHSAGQQQQKMSPNVKQQQKKSPNMKQDQKKSKAPNQNPRRSNQEWANSLNLQAKELIPTDLLKTSTYTQHDLERAFHQEMNKITDSLMKTPFPGPGRNPKKLKGKQAPICFNCGQDGHVLPDCTDPDVKSETERVEKAIGSSTVSHQVKLLCDMNFRDHIFDKKMKNLQCYVCDIKTSSLTEYYKHMESDQHKQNLEEILETKIPGNPKRIPLVLRLHDLPNVQPKPDENGEAPSQEATDEDDDDYSFYCRVCKTTCPDPWEEHCKLKMHKLREEFSSRCRLCRAYGHGGRKHWKSWLHARMQYLKRRADDQQEQIAQSIEKTLIQRESKELAIQDKPTAQNNPAAQEKPTAQDKPASQEKPATQDEPAAQENSTIQEKLATQEKPSAQDKPSVQEKPTAQDKPASQEKPATQDEPAAQENSTIQEKLATQEKPSAQDKPSVQEKPTAQDKPASQEKPATQDEPAAQENSTIQEKLATQEKPSAQDKPSVQEKPTAQDKPASQEKPATQDEPAAQENSTIQEKLATQEKPSAQDKPSVQDKPSAQDKPLVQDKPSAQDKPLVQDKPTPKDKPVAQNKPSKKQFVRIPPGTAIGNEFMVPLTGWFCKVCVKYCPDESKEVHSAQKLHHYKLVRYCRSHQISIAGLLEACGVVNDTPAIDDQQPTTSKSNSQHEMMSNDVSMKKEESVMSQQMESSDETKEEDIQAKGDDDKMDMGLEKITDEDVDIEGGCEVEIPKEDEDGLLGDPEGYLVVDNGDIEIEKGHFDVDDIDEGGQNDKDEEEEVATTGVGNEENADVPGTDITGVAPEAAAPEESVAARRTPRRAATQKK